MPKFQSSSSTSSTVPTTDKPALLKTISILLCSSIILSGSSFILSLSLRSKLCVETEIFFELKRAFVSSSVSLFQSTSAKLHPSSAS